MNYSVRISNRIHEMPFLHEEGYFYFLCKKKDLILYEIQITLLISLVDELINAGGNDDNSISYYG